MLSKLPLLGLFLLVDHSLGSCGTCQTNYVACHSESTFSLCIDESPTTNSTITCPVDTVCTDELRICVLRLDKSVRPSCITDCGVCSSFQRVFSCISPNTYAFCFGGEEPFYAMTGSCLDGYVYDLSSRTICVKYTDSKPSCNEDYTTPSPSVTSSSTPRDPSWTDPPAGPAPATDSPGIESSSSTQDTISTNPPGDTSSSTTEDPSTKSSTIRDPSEIDSTTASTVETTTRTPRDAATFCTETAAAGTYKAEGDSTCTKFYICQENNGKYSGTEYTCINSGFFNSVKRECEKERPDDC